MQTLARTYPVQGADTSNASRLISLIGLSACPLNIEQHLDFSHAAPDIRELFDATESQDAQSGLDWYANLVTTTSSKSDEALMLVLRGQGRAIAALPVRRTKRAWGTDVASLANFYTSRYLPPLAAEVSVSDMAELFRAVRSSRPRPRSITLAPLDHASREFEVLRGALRRAGLVTYDYFCFGNWYMPVTMSGEQYLESRPGEVRSTLRRMSRRFESERGRIEILQSPADVERAITAYTQVYAVSWKQPEPYPDFVPGLIRLCAARGWLRLGVAWVGDQAIAAQLWIVAKEHASIFKLAYRPEFARLSPGTLLTAALMKQVIDVDHVTEVDYLTGDDAYKQSWMTHRRERWGLVAYDPLSPGGASLLAREIAGRAVKSVLQRFRPPTG